jgi:hypothetical protein
MERSREYESNQQERRRAGQLEQPRAEIRGRVIGEVAPSATGQDGPVARQVALGGLTTLQHLFRLSASALRLRSPWLGRLDACANPTCFFLLFDHQYSYELFAPNV